MKMIDISLQKILISDGDHFELDVSFNTDSKRIALLGPSGAGKSLTLRMIAGLIRPNSGRVLIGGSTYYDSEKSLNLAARERQVGYVFQDYALLPHLTVVQNIAFGLQQGWFNPSRQYRSELVTHWLDKFELRSVALNYPHQISGGQKQRVALARALAPNPRVLLLDEPFSALDRSMRLRLRAELSALQTELSIPIITITHDVEDAEVLGEEVVQLLDGRVFSQSSSSLRDG